MTGHASTRLVLLRGNSGSGKSTVANAFRDRLGRGVAWVEQDYVRRIVLQDWDEPHPSNIDMIDQMVRYALDHDHVVVLEGILDAARYGEMIQALVADHVGRTGAYYFDLPFDETARRHATRQQATQFDVDDMRAWYRERDLLSFLAEEIITAGVSVETTVDRIVADLALEPRPRPG